MWCIMQAKKLGIVNSALQLVNSSLREVPQKQWTFRFYSTSYLKEVNQTMTQAKLLPKLPPSVYSTLKELGIARFRRGCRSGRKVKSQQRKFDLHIPSRAHGSKNNYATVVNSYCHGQVTSNVNNLTKVNLASHLPLLHQTTVSSIIF